MLYWLIPYLVAYNASNSGDWKYGPEHVFKAEIHVNTTVPSKMSDLYIMDVIMDFACRPMNSSLIQCHFYSWTSNDYVIPVGSNLKRKRGREELLNKNDVVQVLFDEEGISRIWFLNSNNSITNDNILVVIGTLNTGINLAGKKFEKYVSKEKSVIGVCDTDFNITKKTEEEEDETVIEGYEFEVPSLSAQSDNATIVIEKDRNMNECVESSPGFFGTAEARASARVSRETLVELVTDSQSRIYLGKNSFSAYTESHGEMTYVSQKKSRTIEARVGDKIRVSLQSIGAAKEELRNTGNLENVGAGFQPGIPWPKRFPPVWKYI